ncbi:NAD(P)/FAD-dependent oxidoreductase [Pseudomonas typographi]|uniref:FAD-dependent oxidoreductase n=1 Tax=Pseudomonas typographi TaxID=2715964 RepID=A0ABR7YY12_9PSED|nr:FAD-dependent oxidoreductase [Pseudomonas typographi]MBD1587891.1 FAD-dependent oxidoreductase [Pseudomonas typographi]MBD1598099.1 FAD-dependent oxidoreductase [Pseudomonas typographi]
MADDGIVVVGTGQAAFQLVGFLRDEGYAGTIRLVGDEAHLPYQRPPLSKAFMNGDCEIDSLFFQSREHFQKRDIELHLGARVTRIDRASRFVETATGVRLPYSHLVLATGARNRNLPGLDKPYPWLVNLRGLDDAGNMRERLGGAREVVVVGAGFLGLEFAAVAAKKGLAVTVIEAGPTLMGRAISAPVAAAFRRHHEALGVRFLLGTTLAALDEPAPGRCRVVTREGEVIEADLLISSIGVQPNVELAQDAGLRCENGIVVDAFLNTEDPAISAIGDCAAFESRFSLGLCRIESVQNAMDQARCLARTLTGNRAPYDAAPWFWSDQGGLKLQIAGLSHGADQCVIRGDAQTLSFSAYLFRAGRLVAVESVARPADHMAARRLLNAGVEVQPQQAQDLNVDLKSLLPVAEPLAAQPV